MAEGQRAFLSGAAAGLVMLVVAAPAVAVLWKYAAADRANIQSALAAVDGRLDKTSVALEEMRKAASLAGVTKQLDELNVRIKSTNEALAGVQKASLDNIRDRLDRVEAGVKTGNVAIAGLQKGLAPDGLTKQLGQLAANLTALETSLADLKQKMARSQTASVTSAPPPVAAAPPAIKPEEVIGALDKIKSGLDDGISKVLADRSASEGKVLAAIGGIEQSIKALPAPPAPPPPAPPPPPSRTDLVVVHMAAPQTLVASAASGTAATPIAPLSVHFQKIGGTDETAQTLALVSKLKALIKDRQGCAISVAGYADTLGDDDINLAVSKDRAHTIAVKLKEALGSDVQIAETAWGERRLTEMTKDNVASKANRRVDIAVQCKS